MDKHNATIGVFGIPSNAEGKGLWSIRADGKGVNAIGGAVDSEDNTLIDALRREFFEEAGLEIEVVEDRPLGVFPNAGIHDIAILYSVRIVSGEPKPSKEAVGHLWMDPYDIRRRAEMFDRGLTSEGLLSGVGKRQWNMAKRFFACGANREYAISASYDFAPRVFINGNRVGSIVMYHKNAHVVIGVKGRQLDPSFTPYEFEEGLIPVWVNSSAQYPPSGYDALWEKWQDNGYELYEQVVLRKI